MSDRQKYNVIYAGAVASGFDEHRVKQNFVTQLKIPCDKVDWLFSGKRVVLKKSVTKLKAEVWQEKLLLMGAEAAIIPFVDTKQSIKSFQADSKASSLKPKAKYSQTNLGDSSIEQELASGHELGETIDHQSNELDMEKRIRHAESLIAEQRLTEVSPDQRLGNIAKLLIKGLIVASVLLGFLYFYIDLID